MYVHVHRLSYQKRRGRKRDWQEENTRPAMRNLGGIEHSRRKIGVEYQADRCYMLLVGQQI